MEQLTQLLAVNGYIPHGYCISWSPTLMATFVASDLLIFISYFSMPVALGYFAHKRRDFPYRWLLWLFSVFIMACGATHLMGVVVLWEPMYALDALLKAITAAASVLTAIVLWPLLPRALKLPSPTQLRTVNAALKSEITERKRIEDELRLAKAAAEEDARRNVQLLAAIVESSADAIIGKTLDGTVTSWNRGATEIFGYSATEMIGHKVFNLLPVGREQEEPTFLEQIRHDQSVNRFKTQRVRKDGQVIDVAFTVSPIHDQQNHPIGASVIARDITKEKQTELNLQQTSDELRELNTTLEQRIAQRTEDLNKSNARLDQLNQDLKHSNVELEQFAYVASHDLQEPLRMVVGFIQLLEKRLSGQTDAECQEFMNFAVDGALRMQKLIQAILEYSRISSRGAPLAPVPSGTAVQEALNQLNLVVAEKSAVIDVPELPTVLADRMQLVQLFQNLIGNAIKFCKSGPPHVRIAAERQANYWRFTVTDNGIGIAPEYQDRIFGIFQRLHTRQEYDGTGIGLALCKRIAQRHGGDIGVCPAPEGGSSFWFTLPTRELE